jgi:polysaccharide export outer membrane protein
MISCSKYLFVSFHKYLNVSAIVIILGFLTSCVTHRNLEYIQNKNKNAIAFKEAQLPDYRLRPKDELYIQINSIDEAAVNIFSNKMQDYYLGSLQPYGASLISYTIDKDGYLFLPVIGKILVKEKTVPEVSLMIKESLSHILNQPSVSIKLVNRFVSVIGEVRNPGYFPYSTEKLTIYDALGMAGDITDFGNRSRVILVRNENGENVRINLNLNKSEVLSSSYYYLRPNDIVYVMPLRKKFWDLSRFPYATILSALTTGLLFYSIIK